MGTNRSTHIEFTAGETDVLALGWHEALLISRIKDCPVTIDDIVLLDTLTHRAGEVLARTVEESVAALESCRTFVERYRISADALTDSPEALDAIYPMQQDFEAIDTRLQKAINLLKSKLPA